jgi:hypothetical protein
MMPILYDAIKTVNHKGAAGARKNRSRTGLESGRPKGKQIDPGLHSGLALPDKTVILPAWNCFIGF